MDCDTCTVGQDACSEPNEIPGGTTAFSYTFYREIVFILFFLKKDLTKLVVIGGFNLEDGDLDLVQVYDLSGETPGDGLCNTLQV